MKTTLLSLMLAFSLISFAQSSDYYLTISPIINKTSSNNKKLIDALENFLASKDINYSSNKYWDSDDFIKYKYPYRDILKIESGKSGSFAYKPTLMEIVSTEKKNHYLLKVAFIGRNGTKETYLRAIYNLYATIQHGRVVFSRPLSYNTRNWKLYQFKEILYFISPLKVINKDEIAKQDAFIAFLSTYLNTSRIPITYYSCTNPKEIFEIRGFDYTHSMYMAKKGGQNEVWSNTIFSGNNSEEYNHEIVHSYLFKLYGKTIPGLIDEGFATYIAGSSQIPYTKHRKNLEKHLDKNPTFDLMQCLNPYSDIYINEDTSIPYMTGALICEHILRTNGKSKLLDVFLAGKSKPDLWKALNTFGITKNNFNEVIRKEIKREPFLIYPE